MQFIDDECSVSRRKNVVDSSDEDDHKHDSDGGKAKPVPLAARKPKLKSGRGECEQKLKWIQGSKVVVVLG